jgi:DNA-binding LytR/AlgR family response regulator
MRTDADKTQGRMTVRKKLLTILVVEDDLKIFKKIEWQILRTFNRQVQILKATTFEEGKDIILQGLVDISLIDLRLPDGHGEDLIALIRTQSLFQPIIVQTTETDTAYQAKVHNQYENLIYLTKEVLFDELATRLKKAKAKWQMYATLRLALPNQNKVDSIDINEVCYVSPIPSTANLHIEFYDFDQETYKSIEIKYMNLKQFMSTYNEVGYFLRCHNSFVVNKKMIHSYSRLDNQIKMLYPRKGQYDIMIGVSEKYKKDVKLQLKGLY